MRTLAIAALIAAGIALGGCGGDGEERDSAPAAPSATKTATSTSAGGIDPLEGASTEPVVVRAVNSDTALLSDVRAARHEGYDRIVFEFDNALPGYDVRYVERPVTADGSGDPVSVDGAHVLQIRMENASDADLNQPSAPRTYSGPSRLRPQTPMIAELVRTGGFEDVLTWVAGARDRVDFRVTTADDPPRIVIDLRNH